MRNFLALVAVLVLGMASNAWAMHCTQVSSPETAYVCTMDVFNDQGSAITSGSVVAWDQDDTDFSELGRPYIITTTTADDPYTAGVMQTGSCADQSMCTIVVRGLTTVRLANASDDTAADTLIGASTVAGQAGDYATGANTCTLGTLVSYFYGDIASDNTLGRVFVDIDCD